MGPERSLVDVVFIWSAAGGAWLATYWLHSFLLLGAAWLVTRVPFAGRERAADLLWRVAFLGALITATARVAAAPAGGARVMLDGPVREVRRMEARRVVRQPGGQVVSETPVVTTTSRLRPRESGWLAGLFWLWSCGAIVMLARYWRARSRIRALLTLRRPLRGEETDCLLDALRAVAPGLGPVRCSVSDELPAPAALGAREICLPSRMWVDLTPTQRRTVVAHEVAHLARRDPLWLDLLGVLRALLWMQPLNAVAVREWQDAAELRCDDWAARATGRPRALASALAAVAAWIPASPDRSPIVALVPVRSPLVVRVQRLLENRAESPKWLLTIAMVAAMCALIIVAAAGPAVALARGPRATPRLEQFRVVHRMAKPAPLASASR